ncbi:MAG TPA: hypothetical protein VH595_02680 [Verrucomicrobiae bacterium]|nr:hypothetical protein [Verrucomicrobiae bacterium]
MPNSPISVELQQFIDRYIHSVEQLEILCLLVDESAKTWSEIEVFHRIQSSQESVSRTLRRFRDDRFLVFDLTKGYRFSPESSDLARLASELAKAYRERRVAVIGAIYKPTVDSIRDFADAFRIRKDKS